MDRLNSKIYIALELRYGPRGGSFQFMEAIGKSFDQSGRLSCRPEDAKIILFSASQSIPVVIRLRCAFSRAIFVHRIDGPIRLYNAWSDRRDYVVQEANHLMADATIFQSEWSRSENYRLGLKPAPYETVIPNAPDPSIFSTQEKVPFSSLRKTRLIAVSWSANWKKGFETYRWLDEHLDFSKYEMTFVGNSPISFKNIRHLQPLKSQELANELRAHDISVFASEFEACSNALLEALHCGLPVIARNASSNPEVLGEGGELFNRPEEIPDLIARVVKDYESFQNRIQVLSMDEVAERYYAFMQEIHADKTTGSYKPKRLTLFSRARLENTLFRWKLQEKVSARLSQIGLFNKGPIQ